jgi:hypothetical protein
MSTPYVVAGGDPAYQLIGAGAGVAVFNGVMAGQAFLATGTSDFIPSGAATVTFTYAVCAQLGFSVVPFPGSERTVTVQSPGEILSTGGRYQVPVGGNYAVGLCIRNATANVAGTGGPIGFAMVTNP